MTLELLMICDLIKLSFNNFEQVVCNDLRIANDFCDLIKIIFFKQRSPAFASSASQLGRSTFRLSGDYQNQNGHNDDDDDDEGYDADNDNADGNGYDTSFQ